MDKVTLPLLFEACLPVGGRCSLSGLSLSLRQEPHLGCQRCGLFLPVLLVFSGVCGLSMHSCPFLGVCFSCSVPRTVDSESVSLPSQQRNFLAFLQSSWPPAFQEGVDFFNFSSPQECCSLSCQHAPGLHPFFNCSS